MGFKGGEGREEERMVASLGIVVGVGYYEDDKIKDHDGWFRLGLRGWRWLGSKCRDTPRAALSN